MENSTQQPAVDHGLSSLLQQAGRRRRQRARRGSRQRGGASGARSGSRRIVCTPVSPGTPPHGRSMRLTDRSQHPPENRVAQVCQVAKEGHQVCQAHLVVHGPHAARRLLQVHGAGADGTHHREQALRACRGGGRGGLRRASGPTARCCCDRTTVARSSDHAERCRQLRRVRRARCATQPPCKASHCSAPPSRSGAGSGTTPASAARSRAQIRSPRCPPGVQAGASNEMRCAKAGRRSGRALRPRPPRRGAAAQHQPGATAPARAAAHRRTAPARPP